MVWKPKPPTVMSSDLKASSPRRPWEENGDPQRLSRSAAEGGEIVDVRGAGCASCRGSARNDGIVRDAPEKGGSRAAHTDCAELSTSRSSVSASPVLDRAVSHEGEKGNDEPLREIPHIQHVPEPLQGDCLLYTSPSPRD